MTESPRPEPTQAEKIVVETHARLMMGDTLDEVIVYVAALIDTALAAERERCAKVGWNACRKSIYAVCEDVQAEAKRLRVSQPPRCADQEQHAKGYYAGSCYAAKSIARGFNSMEAEDDDNFAAAIRALPAAGGEREP